MRCPHCQRAITQKSSQKFALFGWRAQGRSLLPVPQEQDVIRIVKMRSRAGVKLRKIAIELERLGYFSSTHRRFTNAQLQKIAEGPPAVATGLEGPGYREEQLPLMLHQSSIPKPEPRHPKKRRATQSTQQLSLFS